MVRQVWGHSGLHYCHTICWCCFLLLSHLSWLLHCALHCVGTSAQVSSLCASAAPGSKQPKVGDLWRGWVLSCLCFVSASLGHSVVLLHSLTRQCTVFSFMPACMLPVLRPPSGRPPMWSKKHSSSAQQLPSFSPCRYSYGKAVQGTVRVTLCQKARRRLLNSSKDICREYSGLVSKIQEDTWVVKELHTGLSVNW